MPTSSPADRPHSDRRAPRRGAGAVVASVVGAVAAAALVLTAGASGGGSPASAERNAALAVSHSTGVAVDRPVQAFAAAAIERPSASGLVVKCNTASSYDNVSGHCVHRPVPPSQPHAGASAQCKDGYYSFSEHRRGTCSGHGGVRKWLKNLPS